MFSQTLWSRNKHLNKHFHIEFLYIRTIDLCSKFLVLLYFLQPMPVVYVIGLFQKKNGHLKDDKLNVLIKDIV